jgi:hypothetical protein
MCIWNSVLEFVLNIECTAGRINIIHKEWDAWRTLTGSEISLLCASLLNHLNVHIYLIILNFSFWWTQSSHEWCQGVQFQLCRLCIAWCPLLKNVISFFKSNFRPGIRSWTFIISVVREGRSVGIVRSRTKGHGVCFLFFFVVREVKCLKVKVRKA